MIPQHVIYTLGETCLIIPQQVKTWQVAEGTTVVLKDGRSASIGVGILQWLCLCLSVISYAVKVDRDLPHEGPYSSAIKPGQIHY